MRHRKGRAGYDWDVTWVRRVSGMSGVSGMRVVRGMSELCRVCGVCGVSGVCGPELAGPGTGHCWADLPHHRWKARTGAHYCWPSLHARGRTVARHPDTTPARLTASLIGRDR